MVWLKIEPKEGINCQEVADLVSFLTRNLPQPRVGPFGLYPRSEIFIPSEQLVGENKNLESFRIWIWAKDWWSESIASLVKHWFNERSWPCRIQFQAAANPGWKTWLWRRSK